MSYNRITQPVCCTFGMHMAPPLRVPAGPIVSTCPCCGKTTYFYGLSLLGIGHPPTLMLPSFPKILGPAARIAA